LFAPAYSTNSSMSIRTNTKEPARLIAAVEQVYQQFFPGNSFEYSFLEDSFQRQYRDEVRFGTVIRIFTGLAIVVSCLGLIGLSSYTASQRTREIGIRKALGASAFSIVSLLSVGFMKLVIVAAVLSLPLAWFSMQGWLQGYAYRIYPGWVQFTTPVVALLLIAMITISAQVLRAAGTDPAKTLKYE
jgi:putative ABC transport system permease protein